MGHQFLADGSQEWTREELTAKQNFKGKLDFDSHWQWGRGVARSPWRGRAGSEAILGKM